MKRISQFLASGSFAVVLLTSLFFSSVSQAQIVKPQGVVDGSITMEDAIGKANTAVSDVGYDLTQLPFLETKANLIYNEEDQTYEWVVSQIVENEAEPYLLITIDAFTGEVISTAQTNFFELYDQWELQRQLPHELWSLEDLVLFDTLYRRSDLFPRYTLPIERDISEESAIQTSRDALCNKFDISSAFLDRYECSATLMLDIGNQRKWYVCFCSIESPTQAKVHYQVTLDANSSEILLCIKN